MKYFISLIIMMPILSVIKGHSSNSTDFPTLLEGVNTMHADKAGLPEYTCGHIGLAGHRKLVFVKNNKHLYFICKNVVSIIEDRKIHSGTWYDLNELPKLKMSFHLIHPSHFWKPEETEDGLGTNMFQRLFFHP